MNKKDFPVWTVLVIIMFIVLIIVVVYYFFYLSYFGMFDSSAFEGSNSEGILVTVIDLPFYLEEVKVMKDEITLDIKNKGGEDYTIKKLR